MKTKFSKNRASIRQKRTGKSVIRLAINGKGSASCWAALADAGTIPGDMPIRAIRLKTRARKRPVARTTDEAVLLSRYRELSLPQRETIQLLLAYYAPTTSGRR